MKLRLEGKRFSRLLVLGKGPAIKGIVHWLCRCDCGKENTVRAAHLTTGRTRSCGCLKKEMNLSRFVTHGHTIGRNFSPEYLSWCAARARCFQIKHKFYKNYGGRGITMCARWNDFALFLKDMGTRPPGCTLDRIENDGNYEPGNCRWATWKQQQNNRRNTKRVAA